MVIVLGCYPSTMTQKVCDMLLISYMWGSGQGSGLGLGVLLRGPRRERKREDLDMVKNLHR